MLLIDIRSTNASAAEFILYRLKLYLAGRHHHHTPRYGRSLPIPLVSLNVYVGTGTCRSIYVLP